MKEHKPLKCQQCGSELPFIRYDSKPGKDGREAKWPVYEKCVNPDCLTGKKTLRQRDLDVHAAAAAKVAETANSNGHSSLPKGGVPPTHDVYTIYQLGTKTPVDELIQLFELHWPGTPARMNPQDIGWMYQQLKLADYFPTLLSTGTLTFSMSSPVGEYDMRINPATELSKGFRYVAFEKAKAIALGGSDVPTPID